MFWLPWTEECERLWRNALDRLALALDAQIIAEMEESVRLPVQGPIFVEGSLILRPGEIFLVVPVRLHWPPIITLDDKNSEVSFWLKGVEYRWKPPGRSHEEVTA